ncbi:MAG: hypothetical protein OXH31_00875 [Gammaproteobacteria bacterium]|nr:hypothetical protein [Gammaproteobacteria bacterium]
MLTSTAGAIGVLMASKLHGRNNLDHSLYGDIPRYESYPLLR